MSGYGKALCALFEFLEGIQSTVDIILLKRRPTVLVTF